MTHSDSARNLFLATVAFAVALFMSSCSNKITEEQLKQLTELRQQERTLLDGIAKKQSEAKPAAENLDMMPNSVNKDGNTDFKHTDEADKVANVHHDAAAYAQKEHEKANNWENTNEDGPDKPTF